MDSWNYLLKYLWGGKKVVIFVKVLYAEDNHGNLGSLGNVLYFVSGVLQNTKSFGKYTFIFKELVVISA